jgi:hypothetical protein
MVNEYTIQAVQEEQARIRQTTGLQNIRRLQKKVNDARAELEEAQLEQQNRIMSQELRE